MVVKIRVPLWVPIIVIRHLLFLTNMLMGVGPEHRKLNSEVHFPALPEAPEELIRLALQVILREGFYKDF